MLKYRWNTEKIQLAITESNEYLRRKNADIIYFNFKMMGGNVFQV